MHARDFGEPMRQAEFELIIETIPDAVVLVDRGGRITFANRAAETILGLSRGEITARTYDAPEWKLETVDGKPFPQGRLPFDLVMRYGKPVYEAELSIERPDDKRVTLSVNASPVLDGKGDIVSVVHSFTDITKRKTTEQALQESEQRFRKLLEEIDLVALISDTQGKIIFANKFLLDLIGRTREAIVGKDMFDVLVAEDQREELRRTFIDAIARGELPSRYEYQIVTEPCECRIVSFSSVFLRDAEGNITGVASIGEDVTEQRRAAEEVRESRRQVLDILESISDGFFALDNDWRFTYVNHKAAQLIRRRREELLFRNIWEAVPETVGTKFDEEYHRAVEEKTPVTFEAFYSPLNKWFEVHAYPYGNGLSVYMSDITERKKAEEALKESENRYWTLFEHSPVALWEQDASGVKAYVDELKRQGVKDFGAYFEEHPEVTAEMLAAIKIIDVNRATLELYGAGSKEEFIGNFEATFTKEGLDAAKEFLISYAERDEVKFEAEFTSRTLKGETLYVSVVSFIPPGYEETRSKVFIATVDITLRKQAEELSDVLNRINAAIIATLDPDEIMGTVIDESVQAIGAEQAGIVLREGSYWAFKQVYGIPDEFSGARLTDEEIRYALLILGTKQPVVSDDAFNDERFDPEYMRRTGARSFLAVPLELHGNVIGILFYAYSSAAVPFTRAQIDFATKLGASMSLALENARLYSIKKDVADTMQETLLTVPAHIEGIEFSQLYRQAAEATRVGGDFYDIFSIKDGKVGISVGDIAGTGVQAGILASMVKNAIRAYAYENSSPAQVMAKTSELVRGTTDPGLFVTAFFGILDVETGGLVYCSAGHPPAILKRETLEATLLITSSPVLGAFPALNFIDDEAMLRQGDVVVLYTDGVTEARCRNGMLFGQEQLIELMKSLQASVSIKDMPKLIFNAVMDCTGGTISDDIIALAFGLARR